MNECEASPCSQECANVYGSYQCYCRQGFQLAEDGHSCKGKATAWSGKIKCVHTLTASAVQISTTSSAAQVMPEDDCELHPAAEKAKENFSYWKIHFHAYLGLEDVCVTI